MSRGQRWSSSRWGEPAAAAAAAVTLVDRDRVEFDAIDSTTAIVSVDGTPPQNTEGKELLTVALTPKTIGNKIVLRAQLQLSVSILSDSAVAALFATGRTIGPDAVGTGFAFAATTITRNDGGSWISDGFRVGDEVTIANAEDAANDGISGPITVLTAGVITIGSAAFTVNADDQTVTFSPESNALVAGVTTFDRDDAENLTVYLEAELEARSLDELTLSLRYASVGGAIVRVNADSAGSSLFGPAGIAFLEFEEFA